MADFPMENLSEEERKHFNKIKDICQWIQRISNLGTQARVETAIMLYKAIQEKEYQHTNKQSSEPTKFKILSKISNILRGRNLIYKMISNRME